MREAGLDAVLSAVIAQFLEQTRAKGKDSGGLAAVVKVTIAKS
jgi:hypothetical protein